MGGDSAKPLAVAGEQALYTKLIEEATRKPSRCKMGNASMLMGPNASGHGAEYGRNAGAW